MHGFLDTIRDGAPTAPILVISPILCPMHEDTPGPTVTDPEARERRGTARHKKPDLFEPPLTLRAVREILNDVVEARAAEDPALFYLDGRDLLRADDIAELPDGLRPSPAGYLLIADRFAGFAGRLRVDLPGGSAITATVDAHRRSQRGHGALA